MEVLIVPGINGLGKTEGCEKNHEVFFENPNKLDLNMGDIAEQFSSILKGTRKFFDKDNFLFFGGDHSISCPLVLNFLEKYGLKGRLLVFDAHPDTMASLMEPTHEEWLRGLIEKGFPTENILIVGIRRKSGNVDPSEISYLEYKDVKFIYADEFDERKREVMDFIQGPLYVSFDVDVFNSKIVQCTGYPEEGGLNRDQVFEILEKISAIKKDLFFDFVEVNLEKGDDEEKERTIKVVKKVLKKIRGE